MAEAQKQEPRGASPGLPSSSAAPPGWDILFTTAGLELLSSLESQREHGETALATGARLRKQGLAGDQVAALLSQVDLRRKARAKFGDSATQLLFTQAGLEQASRAAVAAMHARRFIDAGCRSVADLGCGIGTESMAILSAGINVRAIEIDTLTARIAQHNLTAVSHDRGTFEVVCADAASASLEGVDGVFLDPARRTAGHRETARLTNPSDYSPSLDFAFDLAHRLPTGIKLGPGFARDLIPERAEAQWVSVDGQLVEMGLWFGRAARPGVMRSALVMRAGEIAELNAAEDSPDADTIDLGEYLYEPDSAVIRARLIGRLAAQLQAGMVSEKIAYLTSNVLTPTPFAQAFRVIERLPASEKQLSRALAARGIGKLEIKKRGIDVDPAALRNRLRLTGSGSATLILTRVAGKHTALLAERC